MAGQRKLMGEIDRTLKKVTEGVEVFNDIWDKVYAATAQNQKEKHEADLKKEIKKLQRFRDQIKNWIGNSDVKDKQPLVDTRKLIEQKMEEFKVCEKETKTKAYSKEGLAQVERLDPAEQAKQNTRSWIQDSLTQVNEQIEAFECDLERMNQAKGRNKHKAEKENLEALVTRHKWHVLKLEQITRLLDNDALEASDVDELKDDLEYYLEANQEPGFLDTYDDDMYEMLDLDSVGLTMQVGLSSETGGDDAPAVEAPSTPAPVASSSRSKTPKKGSSSSVITGIGRPGAVKAVDLKASTPVRSSSAKSMTTKSEDANEDKLKVGRGALTRGKSDVSVVAASPGGAARATTASSSTKSSPGVGKRTSPTTTTNQRPISAVVAQTPPPKGRSPTTSTPMEATGAAPRTLAASNASTTVTPAKSPPPTMSSILTGATTSSSVNSTSNSTSTSTTTTVVSPSLLAPSVLDDPPPLTEEQKQVLRLVDESFLFMPESHDSEKSNRYVARNPYPVPTAFPTTPSTLFDSASIFEKLDVDSLFFIFYYQQGSYQQYLAARELKRRTWGYHKKYKTWFKRHEEPQVTGDDYEQGTFVYFDYETGWCQRIKTEFTFEYSYLEDELQ